MLNSTFRTRIYSIFNKNRPFVVGIHLFNVREHVELHFMAEINISAWKANNLNQYLLFLRQIPVYKANSLDALNVTCLLLNTSSFLPLSAVSRHLNLNVPTFIAYCIRFRIQNMHLKCHQNIKNPLFQLKITFETPLFSLISTFEITCLFVQIPSNTAHNSQTAVKIFENCSRTRSNMPLHIHVLLNHTKI